MRTVKTESGAVIITLEKQVFGGPQAVTFTSAVQEYVSNGTKAVIVDCSEVELMNSSGLGMIVSAFSLLKKNGGVCFIAGVSDKIADLLRITRLDNVLTVFSTVDEALAAVS